uniref:Putative tail protein n=2 Tax=viral metagenome TaxID=1070528 RepID=A0A6M3KJB4_9ZZZZ
MAHLSGKSGYVNTGSVVAGIKSWTLDYTSDALETTDFADAGVKSYIVGGRGWSGSFEGYKEGQEQILTVIATSPVTLSLYEDATYFWTGSAIITGVHSSVAHDGIVSVSYDFVGIAALTVPTG